MPAVRVGLHVTTRLSRVARGAGSASFHAATGSTMPQPLAILSLLFLVSSVAAPAAAQDLFEGPHWPMPGPTQDLKTGDLDRDGRPDLVLTSRTPDSSGYMPSLGF